MVWLILLQIDVPEVTIPESQNWHGWLMGIGSAIVSTTLALVGFYVKTRIEEKKKTPVEQMQDFLEMLEVAKQIDSHGLEKVRELETIIETAQKPKKRRQK